MPADYFSNMKAILTGLKTSVLNYRQTLEGGKLQDIKTFKVGVLSPMTVFPALAILPESEELLRWYSGNQAVVQRSFSVEVFEKSIDIAKAQERAVELIELVAELYQQDFTLKNQDSQTLQVFDLNISSISFNVVEGIQETIGAAKMSVTVKGRESLNLETERAGVLVNDPTTVSIRNAILDRLTLARTDGLQNVADIVNGASSDSIIKGFPSILVSPTSQTIIRKEAGRDRNTHSFIVDVVERMVPHDKVLLNLIDTVEAVKKLFHRYATWENRCITSNTKSVQYDLAEAENGYLYLARLNYQTESIRNTVFV